MDEKNMAVLDTANGVLHWNNGEVDVFYEAQTAPQKGGRTIKAPIDALQVSSAAVKSDEEMKELADVISGYSHLFTSELKSLPGAKMSPVSIGTVNSENPIAQKPYPVARRLRKQMQAEIDEMLRCNIISERSSPWCPPALLIPKEDSSLHFCLNYQKLNDCTLSDPLPMPEVQEILDELQDGEIFSTFDLKTGYWQVPLDEGSIPATAFAFNGRQYVFNVLPFG